MAKLQRAIDKYPDQRFHQILQNLGIENPNGEDPFYEESEETLARLNLIEGSSQAREETTNGQGQGI